MASTTNPNLSAFTLDRVKKSSTSQGSKIEAIYHGPNSGSAYTSFYASHPFGEEYQAGVELYEISEEPKGGISNGVIEITLHYKTPDAGGASGAIGGANPVGYSSLESDSSPVEHPIEKKPPASAGMADDAWALIAADLKSKGVESWIDPQPNVTRTDVVESTSLTMTEGEIIGVTGKILGNISAWGVQNPTANCWLMTGKRISLNGETKTIVRTAQYNREGWDNQYIYLEGNEPVEN